MRKKGWRETGAGERAREGHCGKFSGFHSFLPYHCNYLKIYVQRLHLSSSLKLVIPDIDFGML